MSITDQKPYFQKMGLIFRAINHDLRRQIIKLIEQNNLITVTEIYVKLRIEQSVASQHLAILRRAGWIVGTRDGKFIYYSINVERVKEIMAATKDLLRDNLISDSITKHAVKTEPAFA